MTKRPDAKCPPRHLWGRVSYLVKAMDRAGSEMALKMWTDESRKAIDEWWDACEACLAEWEKAA